MGLRGPAPLPTSIRVLEGNRAKRPLNNAEPPAGEFTHKPPKYLDDEARKQWRKLVPILVRMRVLGEADYIAMEQLCVAYSTMKKAQDQMNKAGLLYKNGGFVQTTPLFNIVQKSAGTITRLLREFGMTPSARSAIRLDSAAGPAASLHDDIGPKRKTA